MKIKGTAYWIKAPERRLRGTIVMPASKSISNRALVLNALCSCPQTIGNLSESEDTQMMVEALGLTRKGGTLNIGGAGTAMRFLTAYLSGRRGHWTLLGSVRMQERPVGALVEALRGAGARIDYMGEEGYPPLYIVGRRLQGGSVKLPGNVSSQFVSALLLMGPRMHSGLTLELTGRVVSAPYIRLTLELMRQYGVKVESEKGRVYRVKPQSYRPVILSVEGDWSAASYWYAMVSLSSGSRLVLEGLRADSCQGDSAVVDLFAPLGVRTVFTSKGVEIKNGVSSAVRLDYDLTNTPDLAQTLVVASVMKGVPFRFTGLQNLRIKETNRLRALKHEMLRLGYILRFNSNTGVVEWRGERKEKVRNCQAVVETYNDHRMALSFAVCALARREGIRIAEPEVVGKSYPRFWEDLRAMGFKIRSLKH